jgi:hypothetical protein
MNKIPQRFSLSLTLEELHGFEQKDTARIVL